MLHIKKVKPLFTSIVTTGDRFEKDMVEGNLIVAKKGDLKLWQKVIAIGSAVRDIKVGDMVMINASHFQIKKYGKDSIQNDLDNNPALGYRFNWVTIDDSKGNPQECLLLNDRDIEYVFEGEEKDDFIVTPGKPKIILN
jgi:hypothetical protein